jgi:Protein of unknown function (DUF3224)
MKRQSRAAAAVIAVVCLSAAVGSWSRRQTPPKEAGTAQKRATMTTKASGTFDVKVTPQDPDAKAEGSTLGRMSIDKQFHGDLAGPSQGQMLSAISDVKGSAGYVAIERVTGTLHGRSGTFVLQHNGIMTRGAQQLTIIVVPDSATGQLTGLTGSMAIRIADGKHFYDFEYTLPASR